MMKFPSGVIVMSFHLGNRIISGEMGYFAQADNSVFSDGFPSWTSLKMTLRQRCRTHSSFLDVIQRVPSFNGPSGLRLAPSVMKQRKTFRIADGQEYNYLLSDF